MRLCPGFGQRFGITLKKRRMKELILEIMKCMIPPKTVLVL